MCHEKDKMGEYLLGWKLWILYIINQIKKNTTDTIYIFMSQFYKSMILFCHTKNIDSPTFEIEYIAMLHETNQCPSPIPWCWCPPNPDGNEWKCIFCIRGVSPALGNAVEHAPHTAADLSSQTSFHTLGSQAPGHDVQSKSNEDF